MSTAARPVAAATAAASGTDPSGPDPVLLSRLATGALGWLGGQMHRFDPFSATARSATHARAKAALELALLCRCADALGRPVPQLTEGVALIRTLWQNPAFPRLFAEAEGGYSATYALVYAALAPDRINDTQCRAALAELPPGFLLPDGKSPYQRLEIRYYADRAGLRHGIEPVAELLPHSAPVTLRADTRPGTAPLTTRQAYTLTHAAFYLGDFGRAGSGLAGDDLAHARDLVHRMLAHCAAHSLWDLAAELLLTQFILGLDPLHTASGAAALDCLARAQLPGGAIPGRSAALSATPADPAGEFFRKAYHTTLVTALMALTIASRGPA